MALAEARPVARWLVPFRAMPAEVPRSAQLSAVLPVQPARRRHAPTAPVINHLEGLAWMFRSIVVLVGVSLLAVGCASQPAAVSPPVTQTPPPPPPTDTSTLPSPDQKWDVNAVRCQQWIDAADDDRAAAGMFYYGWLAGAHGIHEITPANIQPNLRKVLDYCAEHREVTIVTAFQATLASRKER